MDLVRTRLLLAGFLTVSLSIICSAADLFSSQRQKDESWGQTLRTDSAGKPHKQSMSPAVLA